MENCCNFIYSFKNIKWTKTALTLCLLPFVFVLLIFEIILLCSVQSLGAVVSNSNICASVGGKMLQKGGSAVDAAIATMLCEGIAMPSNAGIGGGFAALLRVDGQFESIAAMPTLPSSFQNAKTINLTRGMKSIGVPGELKGFWEMHQKYGMLSWKNIIEPSIKLCREGVLITEWFGNVLRGYWDAIIDEKGFNYIFEKLNHTSVHNNLRVKYLLMADTLQKIADNGIQIFYEGELGKALIKDITEDGGVLTLKDLRDYKVSWEKNLPTIRMKQRYKVVTTPLPTAGPITALILNIIKAIPMDMKDGKFWYYVVEATKYAFEMSLELGDAENDAMFKQYILEAYENMISLDVAKRIRQKILRSKFPHDTAYRHIDIENHLSKGFSNICVMSQRGDLVVMTSGLNELFGSRYASKRTGIILNTLVTEFVGNEKGSNRLIANKRLFTAYTPTIIIDNLNRPFFLVGASGGPRAVTLAVYAIIRYVMFEKNSTDAISTEDFYPMLQSNTVELGENIPVEDMPYLIAMGFDIAHRFTTIDNFTGVTCIGHRNRKPAPTYNIQVGGSQMLIEPAQELGLVVIAIVLASCISVFGLMLYEVLHPRALTLDIT